MDSPNFEGFHRAQSRLLCWLINPSSLPPKRATICQIQIYICELPNTQPYDTFKCQRGTLCTLSYLNGQKFQFSIFLDRFNITDSQANLISKGIFFESQMTILLCLYRKSDLSKNIIKFYPKQKLWERLKFDRSSKSLRAKYHQKFSRFQSTSIEFRKFYIILFYFAGCNAPGLKARKEINRHRGSRTVSVQICDWKNFKMSNCQRTDSPIHFLTMIGLKFKRIPYLLHLRATKYFSILTKN